MAIDIPIYRYIDSSTKERDTAFSWPPKNKWERFNTLKNIRFSIPT